MWRILYTKQALKDKRTAVSSGFGEKVRELLAILKSNPYAPYPPYEKLVGDLRRMLSRRKLSNTELSTLSMTRSIS